MIPLIPESARWELRCCSVQNGVGGRGGGAFGNRKASVTVLVGLGCLTHFLTQVLGLFGQWTETYGASVLGGKRA